MLDLSLGEAVPGISGTLAFDQLDLRSFLAAFTPFTPGSDSAPGAIDVAFAEKYNLDIRLSSGQGDGRRFLLLQRRGDGAGQGRPHRLRYFRRNDLRRHRAGRAPLRPQGRRRQSRDAAAGQRHRYRRCRRTRQVHARGAGRQGHRLADAQRAGPRLEQLSRNRRRLVLGQPSGREASTASTSRPSSTVSSRAASSRCARSRAGRFRSTAPKSARRSPKARPASRRPKPRSASACWRCPGVIPYVGGGLALSGAVIGRDAGSTDATTAEASFFVGGSWSAPFVSPIFSGTLVRPAATGRERLIERANSASHQRDRASLSIAFATRYPRSAACSSTMRCASRRLLAIDAMMMPTATTAISSVQTALISGVTPSRTWL